MMKVCDVVLDSIWYDPRVRKQLIEYKNHGIEICAVGLRDRQYDEEKQEKMIPCEYNIVSAPNPRVSIKVIAKFLGKFKKNRKIKEAIVAYKPDLIHANDLTALIPAYAAAKKLKCSLIYDSHEINTENYSRKKKYFYSFIMKRIEGFLVRRVDLMICVSHAAADYFAKTYKIEKPMVVTNCSLKAEQVKKQGVNTEGTFEVLNHGQFYEGRGYDIMVGALDFLSGYKNIRLAIRGFGRMEPELRDAVAKSDNKEAFIFYPPVNTDELIEYASKSDVGIAITVPISLNFKLAVSNKLFEYASAGLPVIMSDVPEHRYLNNKYHFGIIIKENSPKDLADAIIKLYTDREFYDACAENAKCMSDTLNWENEFDKLIKQEYSIYNIKMGRNVNG